MPIENISGGGGWREEATYALYNEKHEVSRQFMTTGSARNKQKKYNK